MARKFERVSGGKTIFTRVFAEVAIPTQATVISVAQLIPGEVPAVLYFRSPDSWVLLTSHRVISSGKSGVQMALLSQVQKVEVAANFKAPGYDLLGLDLGENRKVEIHLEPGVGFVAFWNSVLVGLRVLGDH